MADVLVVEDDSAMRALIEEELQERGHHVVAVGDADTAFSVIQRGGIEVVITDVNLGRHNGLTLCRRSQAFDPSIPIIVITAFGSLETAVEALRCGCYDFLTKPFPMASLAHAVTRASDLRALKQQVDDLKTAARRREQPSHLEGTSPEIQRLRDQIAVLAATDTTVLVFGESGSGKELVSRDLHALSNRAKGPFVAENLAAIPPRLLESTLFGHVRGAFTGATSTRTGLFRQAHGGTLLLDEIGELPLELQPSLLRVLQEGKVRPVGSDVELPVDVRVVAATHRDLAAAVRAGTFREDLYYRLAVIDLVVPPLRERGSDILLLANTFLEQHAKHLGTPTKRLHHTTAAVLLGWSWPGNVRELRNAMERAAVLASGAEIMPSDLPHAMADRRPVPHVLPERAAALETLADVERRHVLRVLSAVDGNKTKAARILGLGRKTLYRKLEMWDVFLGQDDPSVPS